GIEATFDSRNLLVGTTQLLAEGGIDVSELTTHVEAVARRGETALLVALAGQPAGLIAVADAIRPTSKAAVRRLQAQGIEVVMLTGDQQATAEAVAEQAGIARVFAGMRPEGKTEVVR